MCVQIESGLLPTKSINGGIYLIENNHACKIMGCGTIRIKMHDRTMITMVSVSLVLNLKKNYIFLSVLEENSYKIAMENGFLKVVCGLLVVMKGIYHGICQNMVYHCLVVDVC